MTDQHMSAADVETLATQYRHVAAHHIDAIAALDEPWPGNAYGILAGIARLAIGLGHRLRENTPYDSPDLDRLIIDAVVEAGDVREAMATLRAVIAKPMPKPGPGRCEWASALAFAGVDLYLYAAGPVA